MKFSKLNITASIFTLGIILSLFFSCEKNEITTSDTEIMSLKHFSEEKNSNTTVSIRNDDLVYLEIPEEYLAEYSEEVILIEENGPFYTEDGEEIEGSIVVETTEVGGTFFTIAVSQNLLDLRLINANLYLSNKPWIDYYNECLDMRCPSPQPPASFCSKLCSLTATSQWLLQV